MSLRKCPDCGHDVSSAATACPHCGRPNRRSSSPVELSGILILAVVCAGALIWRLSSRYEAAGEPARAMAPATTIAQPDRDHGGLAVSVGYNRKLFLLRVQNGDSFDWTDCQLSINAQGVSSGYMRDVAVIKRGITEAALLASAEFADAEGRKFDPAAEEVTKLDIGCQTPQGHRSYTGRFQPLR